ncbi:hypothetical protein [Pseudalkalibacillus sp. SCS-8]|uniref:hypothetical protein n=1 Tax=Pseudalkalibacillus nanhaiensis TaxID=3115291 RepID=UPI0032DAD993
MSAWLSLTKKELRLGLFTFLVPIVALLLIGSIAAYIGYRAGNFHWEVLSGGSALASSLTVFYLSYYMLSSLQSEKKKLHIWLHNPLPAYALLLAKLVAGLISMIVTVIITVSIFAIAINQLDNFSFPITLAQLSQQAWVIGIHYFMFSINLAVWFILFWMIYLVLTRFIAPSISVIITFIIFILTITLYNWFAHSWIYEFLTGWGEIKASEVIENLQYTTRFGPGRVEFSSDMAEMGTFVGEYVFGIVLTILIFIIASWMLDRKVEV